MSIKDKKHGLSNCFGGECLKPVFIEKFTCIYNITLLISGRISLLLHFSSLDCVSLSFVLRKDKTCLRCTMNNRCLTLKSLGYRVSYFAWGGGFRPPYEINAPIHIQTCHTCHNPIFLWRSRRKRFFPIQSHQRGLERRELQPSGVQQENL